MATIKQQLDLFRLDYLCLKDNLYNLLKEIIKTQGTNDYLTLKKAWIESFNNIEYKFFGIYINNEGNIILQSKKADVYLGECTVENMLNILCHIVILD